MALKDNQINFLKKIVPIVAFIAGLCCFTPVILVLFGLATVAFAASLTDVLYGQYKWAFRGAGLLLLGLSLFWYFYKKEKICTIDEVKKRKRFIINFILLSLIIAILAYIIWLYVIVEIFGLLLGIWS